MIFTLKMEEPKFKIHLRVIPILFGLLIAFSSYSTSAYAQLSDANDHLSGSKPTNTVEEVHQILKAFYRSTNGGNWSNNHGWDTTAVPSSMGAFNDWNGLGYDLNRNHQIYIDLSSNGLTGSIPPELGNLENLRELGLGGNQLSGSIPPELGNLENLRGLGLGQNNLSGSIPPELGNFNLLDFLYLSQNNLSGSIPPELGNLENLRELGLSQNNLSGSIPPELGNLNLLGLDLWQNNLSGSIPPELGNLNLRELNLSQNNLSGSIPPELGNLNLRELNLSQNNLSGSIPPELGNLALSLLILKLNQNNLSGSIPPELGNLKDLRDLNLRENNLSGPIPDSFLDHPPSRLRHFNFDYPICVPDDDRFWRWLYSNRFFSFGYIATCGYPHGLELAESLCALYSSTSGDSWKENSGWEVCGLDEIPNRPRVDNWYGLTYQKGKLVTIDLNGNNLSGSFPSELDLLGVESLNLSNNRLTGQLSSNLINLTNLKHLDLSSNQIFGSIPPELSKLEGLISLSLGNNEFFGAIPSELGKMTNLETLNLSDNGLNGLIPPELDNLLNLRILNLGGNQLSGSISPDFGQLISLTHLHLNNNRFLDPLPSTLLSLPNLKWFSFQGNSGLCAPPDNGFQTWLNQINKVVGPTCVPSFVDIEVIFKSLRELYRSTNGGSWVYSSGWDTTAVPSSMKALSSWYGLTIRGERLVEIDLRNNFLSGKIPPELGNLAALERLFLDKNQISGSIPTQLGNISWINWIGLSENRLTGSIPASLGDLLRLEHLYLNDNQLVGQIPPMMSNLAVLRRLELQSNQLSGEIPRKFLRLNWLSDFQFQNNAGLCSPSDPEFQQWLNNIDSIDGATCTPVSVEHDDTSLPVELRIDGNYPNPFNTFTRLRIDLPWLSSVGVEIFDVTGRRLLATSPVSLSAGRGREIHLNELSFPAGVYLFRIAVESTENGLSVYHGTLVKGQ